MLVERFSLLLRKPVACLLAGASVAFALPLRADVRLPRVFGDHMVLQQEKPVKLWGWAAPGEKIEIRLGEDTVATTATQAGEWKAELPARRAGGPLVLTVAGSNTVRFEDVLVGEVWLCSGQSNMEMGVRMCANGADEAAAANYPAIRLLMVPNRWSPEPQTDLDATWKPCSPESVGEGGWGGFSAAGYYFGRELHRRLGVPVGLIDATWGGTRIEPWTPPEGFAAVPALAKESEAVQLADPRSEKHRTRANELLQGTERWIRESRAAMERKAPLPEMPAFPDGLRPPRDVQHATALYNGMLNPVRPFALRGAIWYQGESNSGEGALYTEHTRALVAGWREVWSDPTLAYYYVQIAPYNYGGPPETIAEFWEAQAAAQTIPGTGMVVINDIGDLKDIHPVNKQDVGLRLANWALARTYGKSDVSYASPTVESVASEGATLRVTFRDAEGLSTRDGQPPSWFEIIDADDGGFEPAQARIEGRSVLLASPAVPRPVGVRFAWSMLAEPNLKNAAGLPVGAFRAGQLPKRDLLALKVRESREYRVVYDLDLAKLGPKPVYDVDDAAKIDRPFDRVAYFLELTGSDAKTQYVYVSMDAFTDRASALGLPTAASGIRWQQAVRNLNVFSNVKGVVTGTGLKGGHLEFWPNNYAADNGASVDGASGSRYDFGDQPAEPLDGYGSMQVHNVEARQTLFALNHWGEGGRADLGIGNQAANNTDWTFAANAASYTAKRLRVLVRLW
ncbi:MAG: 9-O-acetylesterase [Verrucomicrobiales bacterium]|nr:9-O-acetylesterase [Verrucomicrobiales bacterium]